MNLNVTFFLIIFTIFFIYCDSVTIDNQKSIDSTTEINKSTNTFVGQPFDEIVVESTLNVKRKSLTNNRNNRHQSKRQVTTGNNRLVGNFPFNFPSFPSHHSVADASAQAQSHQINKSMIKFGAAASGSQSQSLTFGPNGPFGSAAYSGSQHYQLPNGQTFDVSFGTAGSIGGIGTGATSGVTNVSYKE